MQWNTSKSTPVYFFSSVRAESGKSTILSNLAVYLNSLGYKIAVIDFDYSSPQKLQNAFSESIDKKIYLELTTQIKPSAPRFEQNFQFSETNKISIFPAHQLSNPLTLFTDTAFKDYFFQLANIFDYVLINLAPGLNETLKVSDLLSKSFLWRGCRVVSLIISLSEKRSLINLDSLIQNNQIISYQAEENTFFIFNKATDSYEDTSHKTDHLSISSLRVLFTYPLTYIIPYFYEVEDKSNNLNSLVLQKDSNINQHIIGLFRILNGSASINYLIREANTYHSCISGSLLSRIYPYIENIQKKVAAKLFISPDDVNVYVEQNEQNFRIRIRLTSLGQKLLGIRSDIPDYQKLVVKTGEIPSRLEYSNLKDKFRAVEPMERETPYSLSFKSVFTFDDSFYSEPITSVNKNIPIEPIRENYPSPIIFGISNKIPEIPTLSNILGLTGDRKYFNFTEFVDEINKKGVSPVFVPTEFKLSDNFSLRTKFNFVFDNFYIQASSAILNEVCLVKAYEYILKKLEPYKIFDIFARNKNFKFISDFGIKIDEFCYDYNGVLDLPPGKFSLLGENTIDRKVKFLEMKDNTSNIGGILLSKFKLDLHDDAKIQLSSSLNVDSNKCTIESPKLYFFSNINSSFSGFYQKDLTLKVFSFASDIRIKAISFANKLEFKSLFRFFNRLIDYSAPQSYLISPALRTFKEGFLSKIFRPLPVSLGLEDVMLEYNYIIQVKEDREKLIFDANCKKGLEYKPEFSYRFEHKYMEPDLLIRRRYSYKRPLMYQLFKLNKLRVSNKIIVSATDYRIAYNEIFPVIYIPKAIEIPIIKKYKNPEWLYYKNQDGQNSIKLRLQIEPLKLVIDRKAVFNTELPPKKPNYSNYFDPSLETSVVNIRVSAPNKPKFLKNYLEYKTLPLLGAESLKVIALDSSIELKDDSNKNIDSTLVSEISNPDIFIEKIRYRIEKFISFNWKNPTINITSHETRIFELTPLKIQSIVHHENSLIAEIKNINYPRYPLRIKTLRLIDNFTNLKNYKPIFDFYFKTDNSSIKLFIIRDKALRQENNLIQKEYEQKYREPKLITKYILKKLANKLPTPKLGRSKFFVIPEKVDDILYKHLLWQFSSASGPKLCEYNDNILKEDTLNSLHSFDVNYELKPLLGNVEFLHHEDITLRLNKKFIRGKYRIQNNHIKDLLALAKAQATKASLLVNS